MCRNRQSLQGAATYHSTALNRYLFGARNPNITFETIERYPDKLCNWDNLSCNPNITFETIEKYSDKPWDWDNLSHNPNITFETIEKYSDKPWNWYGISRNPNLFRVQPDLFVRKWFAALKINWLDLYYTPSRNVCKKRLMREFHSLPSFKEI